MTHEQLLQLVYLQGVKLACANEDTPLEKLSQGFWHRVAGRAKGFFGRRPPVASARLPQGATPETQRLWSTLSPGGQANVEQRMQAWTAARPPAPVNPEASRATFRSDIVKDLRSTPPGHVQTPASASAPAPATPAPVAAPSAKAQTREQFFPNETGRAQRAALRERLTPGYMSMMVPGAGAGALIGGLTADQGEGMGGAIKGGLIGAAAGAGARFGAGGLFNRMGNISTEAAGIANAEGASNAKTFLKQRRNAAFKDPRMQRSALYGLGGAAAGGLGAGLGLNYLFGGGQQAAQSPDYVNAPREYSVGYPSSYGPRDGYYR